MVLRCSYTGSDPIGVELAGALKNVYAIAAGIAEGLGYENNTRAGMSNPLSLTQQYILTLHQASSHAHSPK